MTIHLDTSFLIRALIADSLENQKLRDWLASGDTVAVSSIAWAEFLCGPLTDSELELTARIVGTPLDFTPEHAAIAARLFNTSRRRRGTMMDCMIAAVALGARSQFATANDGDFRRFVEQGLQLA